MTYRAELDFFIKALQKMNLQVLLLTPENVSHMRPDLGLRKLLNQESAYGRAVQQMYSSLRPNAIHKLTDEFLCQYFFFQLPNTANRFLLVGPYVAAPLSQDQLLETAERFAITPGRYAQFEICYASVPIIKDDSLVFALLNALGEQLWGEGHAFEFVDLSLKESMQIPVPTPEESISDPEDILLQMQTMERRYAYENELLFNVSHGLTNRAEQMVRNFSHQVLSIRTTDPVRNIKNYCIVCNTLLRKAAEQGGVHPVQLDRYSGALAKRAEQILDVEEGTSLIQEMVRCYCRLVRSHAVGRYPPLMQKTLIYIDANLSGDLRLQTLARMHNVSDSYLSALFHREYGKTLTQCILEKRVEHAATLLQSTHLQVQTIAQHCGFSDVNYFSKAFKKSLGMTPRQYRENCQQYSSAP